MTGLVQALAAPEIRPRGHYARMGLLSALALAAGLAALRYAWGWSMGTVGQIALCLLFAYALLVGVLMLRSVIRDDCRPEGLLLAFRVGLSVVWVLGSAGYLALIVGSVLA